MAQTTQQGLAPGSSLIDSAAPSPADVPVKAGRGTFSGPLTAVGLLLACAVVLPGTALADSSIDKKHTGAEDTVKVPAPATSDRAPAASAMVDAPYGAADDPILSSGRYDLPSARRTTVSRTVGANAGDSSGYANAYGITRSGPRSDFPVAVTGLSPLRRDVPAVTASYPTAAYGSSFGPSSRGGYSAPPSNVVQRFVSDTVDLLGSSRSKRFKSSLDSSFLDLEDYQDVYGRAAGWNGERYFQYQLGIMFEKGEGVVSKNKAAAYLWYSLAAAQNLEIAQASRERLLKRYLYGRKGREIKDEVYHKFIEIYVFGGPEAAFRLGQILESNFFQGRHDQDDIDDDNGLHNRRLIHAYAAYTLALEGGVPGAEEARLALTQREDLKQYEAIAGEEQADIWSSWIGMAETDSPFLFTSRQTKQALSRGSDFQYRRGDFKDLKDKARSLLSSGRAYKALGDVRNAKIAFEAAIALDPASTAAQEANEELIALTTTCSAARPGAPGNPLADIWKVTLADQQRALRALGYYDGPIDNVPGRGTRGAIRRFLTSLNVDVVEVLNAEQVVELICTAAQVKGSAPSQNMLGVMYAEGIGVVQNVNLAHLWFGKAALQGDASAKFNLGRLYAREIGVPIKRHPQNCAIARSYLTEAADAYHPGAIEELRKLGSMPACRQLSSRRGSVNGG